MFYFFETESPFEDQAGSNKYEDDSLLHAEHGTQFPKHAGQASYTPTGLHTQAYVLFFRKCSKLMGSLIFELFESIPGPLFFTAGKVLVSQVLTRHRHCGPKGTCPLASLILSQP